MRRLWCSLVHLAAPWRSGQPVHGSVDLPFPVCAVSWSIGGAGLALALLGCVRSGRRTLRIALLATGLIAATMVFQLPLISEVFTRLPLIGSMTWARAGFLLAWALAGMAALGLDELGRKGVRWRLVVVALAVQGIVLLSRVSGPASVTVSTLLAEGFIAPTLLLAGWFGASARHRSLVLVAIVAAELTAIGWRVLPHRRPLDRRRPPAWLAPAPERGPALWDELRRAS